MKNIYLDESYISRMHGHFRVVVLFVFLFLNAQFSLAQNEVGEVPINQVAYAMRYEVRIQVDTGFFSTFMFPAETYGHKINLSQALVDAARSRKINAYPYVDSDEMLDSIGIEKSLGFYNDTIVYDPNDPPKCPKANIIVSRGADPASISQFSLEYIVLYNNQKKELKRMWTGISLFKSEYDSENNYMGLRSCFRLKTAEPEELKIFQQSMSVADGFECMSFSDTISNYNIENSLNVSQFVSFAYAESATGIPLKVQQNDFIFPETIGKDAKLVIKEIQILFPDNQINSLGSILGNFFWRGEMDIDTITFHPNYSLFFQSHDANLKYRPLENILFDEISSGRIQQYKNISLSELQTSGEIFCKPLSAKDARDRFFSYHSSLIGSYDPDTLESVFDIGDTIFSSMVYISRYEILELHTGDLIIPVAISPGYTRYTDVGDFIEFKMLGWIPLSKPLLNTLNNSEAFNPGLFRQMTLLEYFRQHLYQGPVLSEHAINQQSWDLIREKYLR